MKYIKAYGILLMLLLVAIKGSFATNSSSNESRPNILWVTIEDSSPQFFGCYGNEDAKTPNIDSLAANGVKFNNAFSTNTVCSPSRSTIITGVRTFKMGTGNHRSNYNIPDYIHGFPYYLKENGYYVTNNSKTDYNVGNVVEFTKEAWNESSNSAGWWNRKDGQPFFAVFNFADSHQSRTMTNPYEWYKKYVLDPLPEEFRIQEDEFDMPPLYNDTPEMRKQFARVYNSISLTDYKIGKLLDRLKDDGLADNTIIFFYADHGEAIPRGKTNGINLGYRVPFVIYFPEKYKELSPWGAKGVVSNELVSFEDLAPTILNMAGVDCPDYLKGSKLIGEKRTKPTDYLLLSEDRADNGIDMSRTITDGKYIYSRNYMPFMPECRYIRYFEVADIMQLMRNDFKAGKLDNLQQSLFEERAPEVLYDIENDLWETNNLVNNPKYADLLNAFRKQLDKKILSSKDAMFMPEYEVGQISRKGGNAYEFRLNKQDYNFKSVYKMASISGKRGESFAKLQIEGLHSKDKFVRYWALVGLRSQSKDLLRDYKEEIEKGITDSYPPNAITASAVAWESFKTPAAESTLKECILQDNQLLSLMAINYLIYSEDKEPFIATVKKARANPANEYTLKASCMDFLGVLGLVPNDYDHQN